MDRTQSSLQPKKDRSLKVIKIAIAYRLLVIILSIFSNALVGEYDSSSQVLYEEPDAGIFYSSFLFFLRTFTRWDSIHFLNIARKGYYFEHQFAFFPALPFAVRTLSHVLYPFTYNLSEFARLALSGLILSNTSFVLATWVLYKLTLSFCDEKFAFASALLYTSTPTPGFMSSIYTEPFFSLFTFSGTYFYHKKKLWYSAVFWMIAASFRSNGMLLAGYFIYDFLFISRWSLKTWKRCIIKAATCFTQCSLVLLPFFSFQLYAYKKLCLQNTIENQSSWCQDQIPLIYPYVQLHYWNCGFLKYFRTSEIPSFLLAAPLVILSTLGIGYYAYSNYKRFFSIGLLGSQDHGLDYERPSCDTSLDSGSNNYLQTAMLPHIYLWLVLVSYGFTSMHVQVLLRFLSCMPAMYWFAAHVVLSNTFLTTVLTYYWIVYGLASVALFAGFFPPA